LAELRSPAKGLIGPWAHEYPHLARPGPQIGFLQECLRWWDQWLKGRDTGIMREPKLRAWIQESVPPASDYDERPGCWVAERRWPPRQRRRRFHFGAGRLLERRARGALRLTHRSPLVTGITWGEWCPYGFRGELPSDQRPDDGRSLTFNSDPLPEATIVFGAPFLALKLAIDQPVGLICARLCDVAPDGSSRLITYGIANLTHRDGHDSSVAMKPHEPIKVNLLLNDCCERVAQGHRLRLALSTSYWPMIWPSPQPVSLALFVHECALVLGIHADQTQSATPRSLPTPEMAPPLNVTRFRQARRD